MSDACTYHRCMHMWNKLVHVKYVHLKKVHVLLRTATQVHVGCKSICVHENWCMQSNNHLCPLRSSWPDVKRLSPVFEDINLPVELQHFVNGLLRLEMGVRRSIGRPAIQVDFVELWRTNSSNACEELEHMFCCGGRGRLPNHKVKPSPEESILKTFNGKRWTKSCNGKKWNRASHGETGKSIGHLRCCYQTQVHDETNAAIKHRCMNINLYNTGAWTYRSQKHASIITRNP